MADDLPWDQYPVTREVARRVLDYLAGDGRQVLILHAVAQSLVDEAPASQGWDPEKYAAIGARLDRETPPDEVLMAAFMIEDEVLRDLFISEVHAVGYSLTDPAGSTGRDVAPLGEITGVVQYRLDTLETLAANR